MKLLLIGLGVVLAVVAIIVVVGSLLPQKHVASRQAQFRQQPEAVWEAITNVGAYPSWRKGVKAVEVLPDANGHKSWREVSGDGKITMEVVESKPSSRLIVKITDKDLPFGGTWTYEIGTAATGATLKITENGEVYNPVYRFVSKFIMGHEATIKTYLESLGQKFGEIMEAR